MKRLLQLLIAFPAVIFGQSNTEVYMFDLQVLGNQLEISNGQNISNNRGYDNQPSFINTDTLLYVANRHGQTDVRSYSLSTGSKSWWTHTEVGSEYSPRHIPSTELFSAVRLDTTGKQCLYQYQKDSSEVLLKNHVVGYYVWYTEDILAAFVLDTPHPRLLLADVKKKTDTTIEVNIGRSLHNIPRTRLLSYIRKRRESWDICSLDPKTGETEKITSTLAKVEDLCWLADGSIIMGKGKALYRFDPAVDTEWKLIKLFYTEKIDHITRIAVNADNTKMAIVAEPEIPIAPTLDNIAWIRGQWKRKAFGGTVAEIWSAPSQNALLASHKILVSGSPRLYEMNRISASNNSLLLRLQFLNHPLLSDKNKGQTVELPLIRVTKNKAVFEGVTFELNNDHSMTVFVSLKQPDGSTSVLPFFYSKTN